MTQQCVPGDVKISTISLFVAQGVVNIAEHVQLMSITESIITPGIIAELTVWDTMNIASLLPILGTERLFIEFNTPGRETVQYDLILTRISESAPSENMRSKAYNITAMSPEVIMNKSIKVCKSYNTNISNMISDIADSYLKIKKNIDIQATRGIQKIIVPDIRPFEAIKMLRSRASSIDDRSSSYVFFENQKGFHFKTLENLMSQTDIGDRVFTNDESLHTDITNSEFRNIIGYEQPYQFDILKRVGDGGMAYEVQKFDYKTLEYTTNIVRFEEDNFKNADGTLRTGDNQFLPLNYSRTAGQERWVAHDSGNPDTFIADAQGLKSSGTSAYTQGALTLHVFGDSELTAGQIIETNIVENETATKSPEAHAQLSGKYVIGSIQHIIGPSSTNPRYTCSVDVIKGGYKDVRR